MSLLASAIFARQGMRKAALGQWRRAGTAGWCLKAPITRPGTRFHSLQIPRHFNVSASSSGTGSAAQQQTVETGQSHKQGLFGLRGLHTAEDFPRLAQRCITRCDAIRAELRVKLKAQNTEGHQPSLADMQHTLMLLDAISNEVCRVIDAAELVRNVHALPSFRKAAETAFSMLSQYITLLNADVTLYSCVCAIMDGSGSSKTSPAKSTDVLTAGEDSIFAKLTEEQQLVAVDLRREFEADGIHFGLLAAEGGPLAAGYEETSHRLAKLQQDVTATETSFMQTAASEDNAMFLIGPFGHTQAARAVPGAGGGGAAAARAAAGREAAEMRSFGLQVRHWLTHFVPQDKLMSLKASHGNKKTGFSAKLEGFLGSSGSGSDSYTDGESFPDTDGEYAVCTSKKHVSRSLLVSLYPSEVRGQVWAGSVGEPAANRAGLGAMVRSRQALAAELGYSSYAEKVLSNSVAGNEAEVWDFLVGAAHTLKPHAQQELEQLQELAGAGELIQPWDIAYWSGIQRNRLSEAGAANADRISEYFPLSAAVDALADLTRSLFGLSLRREPMAPGEVWLSPDHVKAADSTTQGAFKLILEGAGGERRGTIYMDLHQRADKFTGAAHFTVQCGCSHFEEGTKAPQLPVVALVFNFPASNSSQMPLLTLGDLTTFFHEFGHALHSVLSQTTYQHLSGTRGPLDFVEVPSHLFEAFTTDIRCLQRWARHYVSGKSPPAGMLEEALAARRSFEALEASSQVLYSLVDQHIFGTRMGSVAGMSNEQAYSQAVSAALALQTEHTALSAAPMQNSIGQTSPYVRRMAADLGIPGEQWHPAVYLPSHSHFVTYGGGYYAYLYAKMCAAQIWTTHFAEDPLSRASGERLWRNMLGYGVSRPPKVILKDVLGGVLNPKHYYRAIGAAEK